MLHSPDMDLSFKLQVNTEALSYRLGFAVQSVLIGTFAALGAVHEFLQMFSKAGIFPFMSDTMARAVIHAMVSLTSFGFCGGMGFYGACVGLLFGIVCYIAATAEAWDPSDVDSDGGHRS
jgi:hypothetical protein